VTCLLITYDLNKPGQSYADLYEVLKNLGSNWWHFLDSTWLVSTSLTVNQASERIKAVVDSGDHYLILNVTGDSSQGWLPQEAWDWIHKYI